MPEVGRPGTNWKQVTPRERAKLAPLLKHYAKSPHPFTKCVRENRKRFGPRTEQVCAVVKDLIRGGTGWRKGRKGARNLSLEELREIVDMADASGVDCDQLRKARRILDMATPPAPPAKEGLISYRITRGPRKGQVVQGRRGKDGKFYEVRVNTAKGNPRAGRKFLVGTDSKGRPAHIYRINGKRVVITLKPKPKKKAAAKA